jgi:simple sugar transport system permease protein
MSAVDEPVAGGALGEPGPDGGGQTSAARLAAYVQGGGVIVPLLTVFLAFLAGGLVILVTGHNPISTYKAIFDGTGLNWLLPWTSSADRPAAALNLQQTLILTVPLILTGLAVAFAFRCGLFNIGGQGQYLMGSYAAVWAGSSFAGMAHFPHVIVAALGGPLQNGAQRSVPVSNDVVPGAKLHVFWGDPELQGLHIGLFVALAALVVFWVVLNRSTTGYEVRAVGLNPEAAKYGGMSVARNYLLVMAVCGFFAGLAGAMDVLGWQFRIATNDIDISQIGFYGIAVALLGRNTAVGTFFAALLFGGLLSGTSQRNLDPTIFEPELASNLTTIIQGLVVLFVSADVLVISILRSGRRLMPWRRSGT